MLNTILHNSIVKVQLIEDRKKNISAQQLKDIIITIFVIVLRVL